jgi:tetratricopeptide (TPR) repeat protein
MSLATAALGVVLVAHNWALARSEGALAGAYVALTGAPVSPPAEGFTKAQLDRMRVALERSLRHRPDWADGHLRLGVALLDLYRSHVLEWIAESSAGREGATRMADPLWLHGVVHSPKAAQAANPAALIEHEPVRLYLVPAARSFLEARRCCPTLAQAHAWLASLDFLLDGGDPSRVYAERALRLTGADVPVLDLAAQVAVQAGDPDLAALCWRKMLEVDPGGWEAVADDADAVLDPDTILERVIPPQGRLIIAFANRLYPGEEGREVRARFMTAALECLPLDPEITPPERFYLEASSLAELGDRPRARERMSSALVLDPLRGDWREEYVGWLVNWGELEEAHRQATIGARLSPDRQSLRRAMETTAEALARGGAVPSPEQQP